MPFCGTEEDRARQGAAAKSKTDKPCDDPVHPCPPQCKPIASIEIRSVKFLSDHGLLKDHDADWKDGGAKFAEPEWTPARSHPVSHTMDRQVEVELTFVVTPADACPETGDLLGTAPGGLTFEKHAHTFSPGEHKVVLKSTGKLPKKIEALAFDIAWSADAVSAGFTPASTATTMFVTMDTPQTPRSPGVTLKRMRHAVHATGGAASLDPHEIVRHVMSKWSTFNLQQVYDNEWELADDARDPVTGDLVGADCQTIVRHTESVIRMVGCPGIAEFIVVWARVPAPTTGIENPAYTPNMSDPKQWYNAFNAPRAARAKWRATLVDHGGGQNRYEACLKFEHGGRKKYYAGGVGRLDNVNQVIGVFKTMSWRDDDTGALQGVIHAY